MPGGRREPERLPLRRLDADDVGAEALQLAARERAWCVAREVDDEQPGERLHGSRS